MSSPALLAELLELTARKLHSRGHAGGLFPAQWAALRYFASAPAATCTSSDLARFQGIANGPVSRTVRTLVQKGLVAKAEAQPKGRAELLEVTGTGLALLQEDPTLALEALIGELPERDREALARSLDMLSSRLG